MTTITSNKNEFNGHIHSDKNMSKYDFTPRSGCAGYALLLGLIAFAAVLFVVVIPALMK